MTTYDLVAQKMSQRIRKCEWRHGMRLPPERDLADNYDVARNTIRKALNALEGDGLISRNGGRGSYVISATASASGGGDALLSKMALASPFDVKEVRLIVEPQVAALAAGRASERNLELIEMHC